MYNSGWLHKLFHRKPEVFTITLGHSSTASISLREFNYKTRLFSSPTCLLLMKYLLGRETVAGLVVTVWRHKFQWRIITTKCYCLASISQTSPPVNGDTGVSRLHIARGTASTCCYSCFISTARLHSNILCSA